MKEVKKKVLVYFLHYYCLFRVMTRDQNFTKKKILKPKKTVIGKDVNIKEKELLEIIELHLSREQKKQEHLTHQVRFISLFLILILAEWTITAARNFTTSSNERAARVARRRTRQSDVAPVYHRPVRKLTKFPLFLFLFLILLEQFVFFRLADYDM